MANQTMPEAKDEQVANGSLPDGQLSADAAANLPSASMVLRKRREEIGLTIDELARALCIRRSYLRAIEDGNFDELPEGPYKIGYLRNISAYLDLDPDGIIKLYKQQSNPSAEKPDLDFPSAVPETRRPGALVILIGLLLAGVVYGSWMLFHNDIKLAVAPVVDEVPVELEERLQLDPSIIASVPTEDIAAEAEGEAIEVVIEEPTVIVEPEQVTEAITVEVTDNAPEVTASTPEVTEEVVENVEQAPAVEITEVEATAETVEVVVAEPVAEVVTSVAEPTTTEAVVVEEVVPAVTAIDPNLVQIIALQDAWMEIRLTGGKRLFSGILKQGNSYDLPAGAAGAMVVGNAGGIQITVGGKELNAIGPVDRVRRNIPLTGNALIEKYGFKE